MRLLVALLAFASFGALAAPTDDQAALHGLRQPGALLIDVRTQAEFTEGALPGALRIDYQDIAEKIAAVAPDKDTPIVLYCRSGRRSSIAQDSLQALGYRNVSNAGGYERFRQLLDEAARPCERC